MARDLALGRLGISGYGERKPAFPSPSAAVASESRSAHGSPLFGKSWEQSTKRMVYNSNYWGPDEIMIARPALRDTGTRLVGKYMKPGDFHRRGAGMDQRIKAKMKTLQKKKQLHEKKHKLDIIGHTADKKQKERTEKTQATTR